MKSIKKPFIIAALVLVAALSGWKAVDYLFLDKFAYCIYSEEPGASEQIAQRQANLDKLGVSYEVKPLPENNGLLEVGFKTGIYILRRDEKKVREWEKSTWPKPSASSSSEFDEDLVYVWQYES